MILWELLLHLLDIGDACDDDADGDGIPNKTDNCPLVPNPKQEPAIDTGSEKGKACYNDFDGDGVEDHEDVCPENPKIQHTNFGNLMPMDLCETSNTRNLRKTNSNSCKKPKPLWDQRDNGKEIYQGRNSRVEGAFNENITILIFFRLALL